MPVPSVPATVLFSMVSPLQAEIAMPNPWLPVTRLRAILEPVKKAAPRDL